MSENKKAVVGAMGPWGKTWLIITGASRGLGAGICESLASELVPGSVIVGIARSKAGLEETGRKVKAKNSEVQFVSVAEDLGKCSASDLEGILEDSLRATDRKFDRAFLVHNAGSLGKLDYLRSIDDMDSVNAFFNFNVSSLIPLTSIFLRKCRDMTSKPKEHVINISSLFAIKPIKSWGLYCSSKAARDMMFKTLAEEEETVDVLNYSPGPLDNEMQVEARTYTSDPEIQTMLKKMKEKLLKVNDSVQKLKIILESGKYASGDHIDYFDEI